MSKNNNINIIINSENVTTNNKIKIMTKLNSDINRRFSTNVSVND